jgi:hypothetical protein
MSDTPRTHSYASPDPHASKAQHEHKSEQHRIRLHPSQTQLLRDKHPIDVSLVVSLPGPSRRTRRALAKHCSCSLLAYRLLRRGVTLVEEVGLGVAKELMNWKVAGVEGRFSSC